MSPARLPIRARIAGALLAGALLVGALPADPAVGAELRVRSRFSTEYDSNLLGNVDNEKGGITLGWRPSFEVTGTEERLDYRLRYSPLYRYFPTEKQDAWSHDLFATGSIAITPTLRLSGSERFSRLKSVDFDFFFPQEGDPTPEVPDTELDNRRTKSNRADVGLAWQATRLDSVTLRFDHTWSDFGSLLRGASTIYRGSLAWQRRLNARTGAGLAFSASQTEIAGIGGTADQSSRFYNASFTLAHTFSEDFTISIQAGPTLVEGGELADPAREAPVARFLARSEDGSTRFVSTAGCPTVRGTPVLDATCGTVEPPINSADQTQYLGLDNIITVQRVANDDFGSATSSLTYFANILIQKGWGERWETTLSYRRQAASSFSQLGSSTVADVVTGTATWLPSTRWSLRFSTSWVRRSQVSDQPLTRVALSGVSIDRCLPAGTAFGSPPVVLVLNQDLCGGNAILGDFGDFEGVASPTGLITERREITNEQDQILVNLTATYRWSDAIQLAGGFNYRTQSFQTETPRSDISRWRVSFSVTYRFEPIPL